MIFVPEIVFPRLPMKQSLIMCVLGVEFNCIPVKSFSMFFVRKLCSMLVDVITEGAYQMMWCLFLRVSCGA